MLEISREKIQVKCAVYAGGSVNDCQQVQPITTTTTPHIFRNFANTIFTHAPRTSRRRENGKMRKMEIIIYVSRSTFIIIQAILHIRHSLVVLTPFSAFAVLSHASLPSMMVAPAAASSAATLIAHKYTIWRKVKPTTTTTTKTKWVSAYRRRIGRREHIILFIWNTLTDRNLINCIKD